MSQELPNVCLNKRHQWSSIPGFIVALLVTLCRLYNICKNVIIFSAAFVRHLTKLSLFMALCIIMWHHSCPGTQYLNYSALSQLRAGSPKKIRAIQWPAVLHWTKCIITSDVEKCSNCRYKAICQILIAFPLVFCCVEINFSVGSQSVRCFWETSAYPCIQSAPV